MPVRNSVLVRIAVVTLAGAVLVPAVVESQIRVICGVYRNSRPDEANRFCHGRGDGCMECTFIELSTAGDGEVLDSQNETAVASYTPPLFDQALESSQPVRLAIDTGLALTLQERPCDEPGLLAKARTASREHVPPARRDRSRRGLSKQVSAR